MATLHLNGIEIDVDLQFEFIDGSPLPTVSGGSIRVDKEVTTAQISRIVQAIKGNDSTPLVAPHGHGGI